MKCSRIQDKLLLFQASELPAAESEQVRQHLRGCVCCRAVAAEVRELERVASYALATPASAPANLDARVMAAICVQPKPSIWRRPITIPRFSRTVYAALALLLITTGFALGMWAANSVGSDTGGDIPPPAPCVSGDIIPGKSIGPMSEHPPKVNGAAGQVTHPKGCTCLATPSCRKGAKVGEKPLPARD